MAEKDKLIILDFDGFLINSYQLLKSTFEIFGLDVGDEGRFRHRRKFLKYLGGGKEFLNNLVSYSLPKKKKIRQTLTEIYRQEGCIYPEFTSLINTMIANPKLHVGIISRNFTLNPGLTIRQVLVNSMVEEAELDFIIPLDVGVKKSAVLEGMRSSRYRQCVLGGDEIGDYRAASETGYDSIIIGSYGFDDRIRLVESGGIPPGIICDSADETAWKLAITVGLEWSMPKDLAASF